MVAPEVDIVAVAVVDAEWMMTLVVHGLVAWIRGQVILPKDYVGDARVEETSQ